MSVIEKLSELRTFAGNRRARGLPDDVVERMAQTHPQLGMAVEAAIEAHRGLRAEWGEELALDEADLVARLQSGFVNFYQPQAVNPFVPVAARGPWIITSHGAVLHDNGGYGMLGMGHAPPVVIDAMAQRQVMANIMTPSFSHRAFTDRMRRELGHTRQDGCPFHRFLCINSGSEAMTVARRLADVNARQHVGPGGPREGARVVAVSLVGSFHGRTGGPARISDSTRVAYEKNLWTFRDHSDLVTAEHNNIEQLEAIFANAERFGVFIEAIYFEPCQGEGNPGKLVDRAWYDAARRLTSAHGTLLIADSIQAGLRATGALSIVDYPGFEDAEAPDIESWSKALNAGQYPLSVLGMTELSAALYRNGIYGNTMTANPRALDVACAVLDGITPALRRNIRDRGVDFLAALEALRVDFPDVISHVQGSGLLLCAELHPDIVVVGFDAVEERCRLNGLGVVHGGQNALRFTSHFDVDSGEIALIMGVLREVFTELRARLAAK
jgi:acetylornithine/succinyldiaminopimelate/putrescine aminotransferase